MKYLSITDADLIEIADAIRSKTGKTAELTLEQMPIEIAGIAGGGRPKTLLYELPSSMEFDGESTYIDTGVQLMKEKHDFTILIDFASASDISDAAVLFYCMYDDNNIYPGIAVQRNNNYSNYIGKWQIGYYDHTKSSGISANSQNRIRMVISGGGDNLNIIKIYDVTSGVNDSTSVICTWNLSWQSIDQTLVIGANTNTGEPERLWKGTMYDFKVLKRAMGEVEANEYLQTGALPATLPITENGLFDVSGYDSVAVDVPTYITVASADELPTDAVEGTIAIVGV